MKDGAVDFELTGPRPDDEVDCCAAVGGPMAAKAAGLPDAASGLVLDGKSQTFDAAVSIHRKLPEMVDRRKELIFGRTSSAPVPHLEWSYDPATWPNVAEQLVEAIKEPFAALTRRPSSSERKTKSEEGFVRTQSTPTPCNTPAGGSDAADYGISEVAAREGRAHAPPRKPMGYRTHHWTHTELGPGSGGQHQRRKKKEQADDETSRIPHRPHVPVEDDLYQVEMRLRHLGTDTAIIL